MEICIRLGFAVKQMKRGEKNTQSSFGLQHPPQTSESSLEMKAIKNKYSGLCNSFFGLLVQNGKIYSAALCLELWPTDGTIDQDTCHSRVSATASASAHQSARTLQPPTCSFVSVQYCTTVFNSAEQLWILVFFWMSLGTITPLYTKLTPHVSMLLIHWSASIIIRAASRTRTVRWRPRGLRRSKGDSLVWNTMWVGVKLFCSHDRCNLLHPLVVLILITIVLINNSVHCFVLLQMIYLISPQLDFTCWICFNLVLNEEGSVCTSKVRKI